MTRAGSMPATLRWGGKTSGEMSTLGGPSPGGTGSRESPTTGEETRTALEAIRTEVFLTSSARQKPAQSVRKGFSKNEWNFQVSFIVCVKFLSNIYEDFYLLNSIPTSDLANSKEKIMWLVV